MMMVASKRMQTRHKVPKDARSRFKLLIVAVVAVAAGIVFAWGANWNRGVREAGPMGGQSIDPLHGQIYPDTARGASDLESALARAAREHKRVIVDFGGNWCGDCHVLSFYLNQPANQALLNANYVLVNINVGELDRNLDIAAKYGIPVQKAYQPFSCSTPMAKWSTGSKPVKPRP